MTTDVVRRVCERAAGLTGDVVSIVTTEVDRLVPLATPSERAELVAAAVARLDGFDALEPLLADPTIDEVLVNRGTEIWVERSGRLEPAGRLEPGAVDVVLQRILAPTGRRLDRSHPVIDARLPDGSRVCAAVAPIAVDGTALAIRRHRWRDVPLAAFGDAPVVELVDELLRRRSNVLVSGGTSSGKTTLLAAALATLPLTERLVLIEDTAEVEIVDRHLVRLEARPANADGVSEISAAALVRAALRLRPDRLVTGEFRGDEALAVVQALNTGHAGSWATCHANGALDALRRLATLVLHAAPEWPIGSIRTQVSRSIDAVVHLHRDGARRRIAEVVEPVESDGEPQGRVLVRDGIVVAPPTRAR